MEELLWGLGLIIAGVLLERALKDRRGKLPTAALVTVAVVSVGIGTWIKATQTTEAPQSQVVVVTPSPGPVRVVTDVRLFVPSTESGGVSPNLEVTESIRPGSCWYRATADPYRADAVRCLELRGEHRILDPCFRVSLTKSYVCLTDPWDESVILIHSDEKVDKLNRQGAHPELPWALVLEDGVRCRNFGSGAFDGIAGERPNYGCDGGGMILGRLTKQGRTWLAVYLPPGSGTLTASRVAVKEIWY
jgi:hypothetical protein